MKYLKTILIGLVVIFLAYTVSIVSDELRRPIDWELLRQHECNVKLKDTIHEAPCNLHYYSIIEGRD